jgi:hypothetical protein
MSKEEKILRQTKRLSTPLANTLDQAAIRGTGGLRVVGAGVQAAIAVPLIVAPEPATTLAGLGLGAMALDNAQAGFRQVITGEVTETLKGSGLREIGEGVGMSPENAALFSTVGEAALDVGAPFVASRASSTSGILDDVADDVIDDAGRGQNPNKLTKQEQVQVNREVGDAFEEELVEFAKQTQDDVQTQVSVRPNTAEGPADFRVRLDSAGRNRTTRDLEPLEGKASETAPLTKNQKKGFPLIEEHGGKVVGKKGGDALPAGTEIPPGTKVRIVRPKDLKEP